MEILLWQVRDSKGISLEKLSEKTKISRSTLNRIENGIHSPTLDQLEEISKALNVKVEELYKY